MTVEKKKWSYDEIIRSLQNKQYVPVYGLMGEENYFLDKISEAIEMQVLNEQEKEFNQTVFYGADTHYVQIIEAARRYPLGMAPYNVVIVKEAQACDSLNKLITYFNKVVPSTILVLCYRYGKLDRNLAAAIEKNGILFESKKLYSNQIPEWIYHNMRQRGFVIAAEAAEYLCDYVGEDLCKIDHELDKLSITLKASGKTQIALSDIKENIGYSRELNAFDFSNAIIRKDLLSVNRMIHYYEQNGKKGFLISATAILFNLFSLLVETYSLHDRSRESLLKNLGITPYKLRELQVGISKYTPMQAVRAISLLREYDGRSKGTQGNGTSDSELLRELAYKLMH